MSISPTIALSTACARPRVSWPLSAAPSIALSMSSVYASWMVDTQISDSSFLGHLGTNHNGTTGSKRLSPGTFEEVLT